ncbi:MAG TPA: sigma-54 dependent transcriptional regulator [Vicinamibacteria bacterium]|jgi:two-component system response regulator AtoC|nr:sigma-54 dependent transcriptional regulator [Vicinamibacteria bacterium]
MAPPSALIVDDDPGFLQGLAELVRREGFTVASAHTLKQAREAIGTNPPHILLVDLYLPDGSGLDLLDGLEPATAPEVVLITGHASVETAVEALRRGVADYLTKPVDFARVKMALGNLTRTLEMKGEIGTLRSELRKLGRFGPLIGASTPMQIIYDLIARVARTDASVLITGETGTGKELVAETIHTLSRRSKEAFLPLNCGAVSATLIESELFGHERGSFTGADRMHKGYFERAHRGTLFLDEITEMPTDLQVRLLRALEASAVTRVGGSEQVKVDVRIVAATSRRVEEAVAAGKLREDLFYRLNVFLIQLPALRARVDDIELLAEQFLSELNAAQGTAKRLTRACVERLRRHSWPGNVRELKNVIHRAFILAEEDLGVDSLSLGVTEETGASSLVMRVGTPIAEMERRLILTTIDHFEGDKKKAADVLKISLKTLYNRLNEYKTD